MIFLSADAFGVLPPVSVLTPEQTKYYFLSGFTAKLAGTERGITEPTPTFSACFGQAFLELHPTKYAEELVKKMEKSGAKAYLVNTGWNGTGKRISIKDTRGIIDAILDGSILKAPTKKIPYFDFEVPTELPGVDAHILDPRDTYADASAVGREGARIWPAASSRTSPSTKATKPARRWSLLVPSCNRIESQRGDAKAPPLFRALNNKNSPAASVYGRTASRQCLCLTGQRVLIECVHSLFGGEYGYKHAVSHRAAQRVGNARDHAHLWGIFAQQVIIAQAEGFSVPTAYKGAEGVLALFLCGAVEGDHVGPNLINIRRVCIIHHVRAEAAAGAHVDLQRNHVALFAHAGLILRQPEELEVYEAALHAEALDRGTARTAGILRQVL